MNVDITQERLKNLLYYNPANGLFIWRTHASSQAGRGDRAGSEHSSGYIHIKIDGISYMAHRLVFLYMIGSFPKGQIDHKDQVKTNNRWSNLRVASPSQNAANKGKPSTNTSGYKGVHWYARDKCWRAQIQYKGKTIKIGHYKNKHQAALAYNKMALRLFGEFAYLNKIGVDKQSIKS